MIRVESDDRWFSIVLSYRFLLRASWQGKRRFFFPTSRYYHYFAIERMLRFNRISKKKEKKEKILDNNWKINNSFTWRDYSISKYWSIIVTYHFEEWKIESSIFVGDWNFLCCRSKRIRNELYNKNERKYANLKKKKENIVVLIRDECEKEEMMEGRRDEKKEVCSIEDHRSRIRSLLSILGCKWYRYIRCND